MIWGKHYLFMCLGLAQAIFHHHHSVPDRHTQFIVSKAREKSPCPFTSEFLSPKWQKWEGGNGATGLELDHSAPLKNDSGKLID